MTDDEIRERAAEAKSIMASATMDDVFRDMLGDYVQELAVHPVGHLTAQDAHASIRVLEAVRRKLTEYSTEDSFIKRKGTKNG